MVRRTNLRTLYRAWMRTTPKSRSATPKSPGIEKVENWEAHGAGVLESLTVEHGG
jgi:hypothetical protein